MNRKYKIAIFDMDGTILNTIEDLADSVNYTLGEFEMPKRTLDEVTSFVGNGIKNLLIKAVPEGTEEETIEKVYNVFNKYYKKHCADKTRPYDGIIEVIKKLRKEGIKTAVVSNKADYGVQALCKDYFDGLFDYAVGEKEGNRRKPYPDAVFEVLKKFGIDDKNEAVYIGDSEVDLATSQNAKMDVIMVGWGFRSKEYLLECGAQFVIDNPKKILDFFEENMDEDLSVVRKEELREGIDTYNIGVFAKSDEYADKAEIIANKIGVNTVKADDKERYRLVLRVGEEGVTLTDGNLSIQGDFSGMLNRLKPGNLQKEILIKAVRIKGEERINVIDATAGMGEDSLILAAAGFNVEMYEYDKVIATLLENAVERGKEVDELKEIVSRMKVHYGDSIEAMKRLKSRPDVILLDPMFPERQKSAMVKKKFQLLQQLEKPCDNELELMKAAIEAHPRKIVVKRPAKGPYLAEMKPSYSIGGKAVRYDCYIYA